MRLTKDIVQKLLDMNEGFSKTTSFRNRNFKETTHYLIKGGKLFIRSKGNTSWADSQFNEVSVANTEQTRRFLRTFINELNTKNIK